MESALNVALIKLTAFWILVSLAFVSSTVRVFKTQSGSIQTALQPAWSDFDN